MAQSDLNDSNPINEFVGLFGLFRVPRHHSHVQVYSSELA